MMLQSGAGLASMGRGETLLHAMPERLIRTGPWSREEEATGQRIFETIGSCVGREALEAMAMTMEQHGLRPLHSLILHFNQAISGLRAQREQKEAAAGLKGKGWVITLGLLFQKVSVKEVMKRMRRLRRGGPWSDSKRMPQRSHTVLRYRSSAARSTFYNDTVRYCKLIGIRYNIIL